MPRMRLFGPVILTVVAVAAMITMDVYGAIVGDDTRDLLRQLARFGIDMGFGWGGYQLGKRKGE